MALLIHQPASSADDALLLRALGDTALAAESVGPLDPQTLALASAAPVIAPAALPAALLRLVERHWLEPLAGADGAAVTLTPEGLAIYLHLYLPAYDALLLDVKRTIVRHQQAATGTRLSVAALAAAIGQPLLVATGLAAALQRDGLIGLERGVDPNLIYVGQVSVFLPRQVRA